MSNDFRETKLRIFGVERVIRTERTGKVRTIKQLESAHTKAVKSALEGVQAADMAAQHEERMADIRSRAYSDPEGFGEWGVGQGERNRARDIAVEEALYARLPKVRFNFPRCNWVDARKGFPKAPTGRPIPTYLVEVAPGEYATQEVAEELANA
ncbi:hypothetical protein [Streptomyces sp. NPDC102264]|uniref:hypothetical protein n=1 Tax=Streptomyces sp. NPDC102264 TaxID=3366149 RepID=UPI0038009401